MKEKLSLSVLFVSFSFFVLLSFQGMAVDVTLTSPLNATYNAYGVDLNYSVSVSANVSIALNDHEWSTRYNITEENTHIYGHSGVYTLNVTAVNYDNSSDTDTKTVTYTLNPPSNPTHITDCGTLSSGGEYVVDNNLTQTASNDCLWLSANDIELDCMGWWINVSGINFGSRGIRDDMGNDNMTIHNCSVERYTHGIYLASGYSDNCTVYNNTVVNSSGDGVLLGANYHTVYDNVIQDSGSYGIYIGDGTGDMIYNNLLNNTVNLCIDEGTHYLNTTKKTGTNIYDSNNPYIGGNYWTNSTGTGYSDTCADGNSDGFCDEIYNISYGLMGELWSADYLPLSDEYAETDTLSPWYSDNSTNSTSAGEAIGHNLKWQDDVGLSGYIFSFDNCTGTFVNDTWQSFSTNPDWSNVTKTANSTVGCTIQWQIYANDTSDNWNTSSVYSYATSSPIYIDVTPNYDALSFTGLVHNTTGNEPALNATNGLYNMSVSSNADWKSQVKGVDFDGPTSLAIGNMRADANLTAESLAIETAQALTTVYADFGSGSMSDVEYHGYWLDVPLMQQAGDYNTTVYLSYSVV